jgi:hypothetical protein
MGWMFMPAMSFSGMWHAVIYKISIEETISLITSPDGQTPGVLTEK